ncbi:methylthioribose kinase [Bacillus sp. PAMC26568]|nr:methylthioribose kinase [Bacillus sp. PAMC26568]
MIQRFIELGAGYSDLYELIETTQANAHRVSKFLVLNTTINGKKMSSFAVTMNQTDPGQFQAIYICLEGITAGTSKRRELFQELADKLQKTIIELEVKSSNQFAEKELFFQYLTGILRMNRYLPPWQ